MFFSKIFRKNNIVSFRPSLFWDTDVKTINPKKNARFVIERVLSRGEISDFAVLKKMYSDDEMKKVVMENQTFDRKSQNFWCSYFNLNSSLCTRNQLTQKQSPFLAR
ncbi:MAG: hypothetical protein WC878_06085 [Candidatus Paceibacterota bacterium]|jgi:hypothetical protein